MKDSVTIRLEIKFTPIPYQSVGAAVEFSGDNPDEVRLKAKQELIKSIETILEVRDKYITKKSIFYQVSNFYNLTFIKILSLIFFHYLI